MNNLPVVRSPWRIAILVIGFTFLYAPVLAHLKSFPFPACCSACLTYPCSVTKRHSPLQTTANNTAIRPSLGLFKRRI